MALILPTISISLKAPVDVVIWVPLVSLLVEAAFMPTFGNYSDRNGRKRYFILGLVLFAIGSFLAGNSLTIYELLIYRVIQSFGSAFILANGRALIVDIFGPGQGAEMTYYSQPNGAKVFDAGVMNFGGTAQLPPVRQLMGNLWTRLSRP